MKKIQVPVREQVSTESQVIFDQMRKRFGRVPNLYATIGYSGTALNAFVEFEATLNRGVFNTKEREAIALVVSEVNSCAYCLAGHTVAAIKNGFTREETLQIRRGNSVDPKLHAIIDLAKSVVANQGHADEAAINNFYNAGFNETALMELIGLVTVRIFTNYIYAITEIPVDFPIAEPIE